MGFTVAAFIFLTGSGEKCLLTFVNVGISLRFDRRGNLYVGCSIFKGPYNWPRVSFSPLKMDLILLLNHEEGVQNSSQLSQVSQWL